jgi:hypothetical protein
MEEAINVIHTGGKKSKLKKSVMRRMLKINPYQPWENFKSYQTYLPMWGSQG